MKYYKVSLDAGDMEMGEVPAIYYVDILNRTPAGLKLINQSVKARGGTFLWDNLFVIASTPLLVSKKAYDQIKLLDICPTIQWYPIEVEWRRSKYPYWAGETMLEHDIWDYEQSSYTLLDDNKPRNRTNVGLFNHGVLNGQSLPDLDLFRGRFNYWIGSEKLKNAWESANLTGMKFEDL